MEGSDKGSKKSADSDDASVKGSFGGHEPDASSQRETPNASQIPISSSIPENHEERTRASSLENRVKKLERELAETKAALANTENANHVLAQTLAETRARGNIEPRVIDPEVQSVVDALNGVKTRQELEEKNIALEEDLKTWQMRCAESTKEGAVLRAALRDVQAQLMTTEDRIYAIKAEKGLLSPTEMAKREDAEKQAARERELAEQISRQLQHDGERLQDRLRQSEAEARRLTALVEQLRSAPTTGSVAGTTAQVSTALSEDDAHAAAHAEKVEKARQARVEKLSARVKESEKKLDETSKKLRETEHRAGELKTKVSVTENAKREALAKASHLQSQVEALHQKLSAAEGKVSAVEARAVAAESRAIEATSKRQDFAMSGPTARGDLPASAHGSKAASPLKDIPSKKRSTAVESTVHPPAKTKPLSRIKSSSKDKGKSKERQSNKGDVKEAAGRAGHKPPASRLKAPSTYGAWGRATADGRPAGQHGRPRTLSGSMKGSPLPVPDKNRERERTTAPSATSAPKSPERSKPNPRTNALKSSTEKDPKVDLDLD